MSDAKPKWFTCDHCGKQSIAATQSKMRHYRGCPKGAWHRNLPQDIAFKR